MKSSSLNRSKNNIVAETLYAVKVEPTFTTGLRKFATFAHLFNILFFALSDVAYLQKLANITSSKPFSDRLVISFTT